MGQLIKRLEKVTNLRKTKGKRRDVHLLAVTPYYAPLLTPSYQCQGTSGTVAGKRYGPAARSSKYPLSISDL